MKVFENDVIITSPVLIPIFFSEFEQTGPDYKTFTEIVAQAVDSVERHKYGHQTFCTTIDTLIRKYQILNTTEKPIETGEELDYKGFSKSVSKVFEKTFKNDDYDKNDEEIYENVFNKVEGLMDEYEVPRAEIPQENKYGGQPLKKYLKRN